MVQKSPTPPPVREKGKKGRVTSGFLFPRGPPTVAFLCSGCNSGSEEGWSWRSTHVPSLSSAVPSKAPFQQKLGPFFPDLFSFLGFSPDGSPGEVCTRPSCQEWSKVVMLSACSQRYLHFLPVLPGRGCQACVCVLMVVGRGAVWEHPEPQSWQCQKKKRSKILNGSTVMCV